MYIIILKSSNLFVKKTKEDVSSFFYGIKVNIFCIIAPELLSLS